MTRTTTALSVFASTAAGMIIGYAAGTPETARNPGDGAERPPPTAGRSLDMGRIMELNPAVAEHYGHVIAAPCKPQMGLHYAPHVVDPATIDDCPDPGVGAGALL
jgi:hypothetical protein